MLGPSMKPARRELAGLAIPANPARALRDIGSAWERFVAYGELGDAAPRPTIARRWQQSRELEIDPFMERAPEGITPDEIQAILTREDLGQAGRRVLDDSARAVAGTGHVILLADSQGRIVYSAGHAGLQHTLDRLNLAPGASWAESAVGPNGIGTPIALGHAETVFGPEHYCRGWQPWVCFGCPVRDPEAGHVVGGVDITGPARRAHPFAFALTLSIARSIEQGLMVRSLKRREILLEAFRALERRWPGDAVLVVSESGRLVSANGPAAHTLGLGRTDDAGGFREEFAPEIWPSLRQAIERGAGSEELTLRDPHGAERLVTCRLDPISRDGRTIGSAIVLTEGLGRERSRRRREVALPACRTSRYAFADLIGNAPALREALSLARAAARGPHPKPILVVGESGTGKELVAHAIHGESRRADRPFVAVNCGALPRELVESELFGHAAGAFTGARREGQPGKFEAAHGGTIFLDEVDSVPFDLQGKFLRVLDGGEVVRLGSAAPVAVDVRVVAASNVDLRARVEEGTFRLDLFHRLGVVEIFLPPLRERREDILVLAEAFLRQEARETERSPLALVPEVAASLEAYHWPGNVRELRNLCARWAVTVEGREVRPEDVPRHVRDALLPSPSAVRPGRGGLRQTEDGIIRQALLESGGRVGEAARRLDVARTTVYRRLKRWSHPG
jgi:sigma-54 dependent transcriptional regulator, acetoin dehydrogenase operon transcriptional activator AcoR